MAPPDRRELLAHQSAVTGIDFVGVDPSDQTKLTVHFLVAPGALTLRATPFDVDKAHVRIRSRVPDADVTNIAIVDAALMGDVALVTVDRPIGFAPYTLFIESEYLDPYFNDVGFSFKVHCPTSLDCVPPPVECASDEGIDFPVDYLARDFWSLRQALLEFAAVRHPDWSDPIVADLGVMLAEAMSALGDEHAYYQDRVAREAYLETATQRRSLRRHARLVDYDIDEGRGASTWIEVTASATGTIPTGTGIAAMRDDGTKIEFEIGTGLYDANAGYTVSPLWNSWSSHLWSDEDTCLELGATSVDVEGDHTLDLQDGPRVLLRTDPPSPDIAQRRFLVTVESAIAISDPLLGATVTRIRFAEPLPFEMDLEWLTVRRNVIPATAGVTQAKRTIVIPAVGEIADGIVERTGPNGSVIFSFSLDGTDERELVWLTNGDGVARPEVVVEGWDYRPSFVGSPSATPDEQVFTLDDGMWRTITHYDRPFARIEHRDYATGRGKTIRFGDGELGVVPARTSTIDVSYRIGGGSESNVPADSIRDVPASLTSFVTAITNPFAATDGRDPESASAFKQLAPEAFRAITYRAVKPEDYAEAVERLPWVQRAGASFRWTGSWVTAFATPDPMGANVLADARRKDAERQLDAFRQAGREAFVRDPKYADLDVAIRVCVEPSSYRAHVEVAVMSALVGETSFFSPDRFTFGTPLERATLEAAIQAVPGVRAVEGIRIRRRGVFDWVELRDFRYTPGIDTVIRVDSDRLHPERGTVTLTMEGGA